MNVLPAVLLGMFVVTSYRSVPEQTDDTPYITSTGHYTNPGGVAVHPRMLCPRAKYKMGNSWKLCRRNNQCYWHDHIHYYDFVYIEHIGPRFVNDVMAWKTKMNATWDIWVETLDQEKLHHSKYGQRRLKVWIIYKMK